MGFFHPFADGGGGGERVLWCAVRAIQSTSPHARIFIYVRQGVTPDALAQDALSRFGIKLERPVEVVQLTRSHLLLPERYPRLTLLLQFAGSGVLAWEALRRRVPEVRILHRLLHGCWLSSAYLLACLLLGRRRRLYTRRLPACETRHAAQQLCLKRAHSTGPSR